MPSLGFITIATGHEHYYKMAYHLLIRYNKLRKLKIAKK